MLIGWVIEPEASFYIIQTVLKYEYFNMRPNFALNQKILSEALNLMSEMILNNVHTTPPLYRMPAH